MINKPIKKARSDRFSFSENKLYLILIVLILIISFILIFSVKSYRLNKKIKDLKSNHDLESK